MRKATITKLFIGGALAAGAGAALAIVSAWIGVANDVFLMNGPDIVGLRAGPLTWPLAGLGIVAALAVMAGLIAGFVSWIGALLNLAQLESKTWFIVVLLLGMINLGVVAMIAYVVAGPDSTSGSGGAAPRAAQALAGA
jgi:hypothetical protein